MEEREDLVRPSVLRLWSRYYPGYDGRAFDQRLAQHLKPSSRVLEIGAGSGLRPQKAYDLRGKVSRYVGIDLDERVLNNPNQDESYVADASSLPFEGTSFDLVFSSMVAEHLEHPQLAFAEVARVLKPEGVFLFETPGRWYYPMLLARALPHGLRVALVGWAKVGRESDDVFPSFYRCNDHLSIQRWASRAGLEAKVEYRSIPPGYLKF